MTQPEALRLAEMFDSLKLTVIGAQNALPMEEAAAELRRQHEEIKCEERRFNDLWDQFAALVKTNEELVEAIEQALEGSWLDPQGLNHDDDSLFYIAREVSDKWGKPQLMAHIKRLSTALAKARETE
jgi:hypothetical protein